MPEFIAGTRLQPVLQPVCAELQIQLQPVDELPALAEAVESLGQHLFAARRPG